MKKRIKGIFLILMGLILISSTIVLAEMPDIQATIDISKIASKTTVNKNDTVTFNYKLEPQPIPVEDVAPESYNKEKEIVLVIDKSGSMDEYLNGKTRMSIAQEAATSFIENLGGEDNIKVALIDYSNSAYVYKKASQILLDTSRFPNYNHLINRINHIRPNGGTNIGDGIRRGYYVLEEEGDSDAEKYFVFLTDGEPTAFSTDTMSYRHSFLGFFDIGIYYYGNHGNKRDGVRHIYSASYKTDAGEADDFFVNYSSTGDYRNYALNYAKEMAAMLGNKNINSFFIAFSDDDAANKLSNIARQCDGNYQKARSADAMDVIYDKISVEIASDLPLKDLYFEETFPEGFEIIDAPVDMEVIGQTVKGNFGSINYNLNEEGTYFIADDITFSISLKAKRSGQYVFGDNHASYFYYKDIDGTEQIKYFSEKEIIVPEAYAPTIHLPIAEDNIINSQEQSNILISGTAEAYSTVVITLEDEKGNRMTRQVQADHNQNWSLQESGIDVSSLADGDITIKAVSTNSYGNQERSEVILLKDTQPPAVTIDAPLMTDNNISPEEVENVVISGIAETGADMTITLSDGTNQITKLVRSDGTYRVSGIDVSSLADGDLTVTVQACDAAGNTAVTQALIVKSVSVTNITIDEPIMGNNIIEEEERSNVTISGETAKGASVTIEITDKNSDTVISDVVTADENGKYRVSNMDITSLANGMLTITAKATDRVGNTVQVQRKINILFDLNIQRANGEGEMNILLAPFKNGKYGVEEEGSITRIVDQSIIEDEAIDPAKTQALYNGKVLIVIQMEMDQAVKKMVIQMNDSIEDAVLPEINFIAHSAKLTKVDEDFTYKPTLAGKNIIIDTYEDTGEYLGDGKYQCYLEAEVLNVPQEAIDNGKIYSLGIKDVTITLPDQSTYQPEFNENISIEVVELPNIL